MSSIIGQEAPNFMLLDDNGQAFSSKNLEGSWRILFFYAKDGSPTCKRGCLTFKEQYDLFDSAGCKIVGVSRDTVDQHKAFKKELGGLPFPLLSDVNGEVSGLFGVSKLLGTFPSKSSFLINPDNKIVYVYDWLFRPRKHVAQILSKLSTEVGA